MPWQSRIVAASSQPERRLTATAHDSDGLNRSVRAAQTVGGTTGADATGRAAPRAVPVRELLVEALRLADSDAPIPFPLRNLDGLQGDQWTSSIRCYASWEDRSHRICPIGDRQAARTVVVYGNSHAGMWSPALGRLGRRDGYRVIPLVKVGCAPFDVEQKNRGGPYPECPAFRRWAVREITRLRPDAVVLAYGVSSPGWRPTPPSRSRGAGGCGRPSSGSGP